MGNALLACCHIDGRWSDGPIIYACEQLCCAVHYQNKHVCYEYAVLQTLTTVVIYCCVCCSRLITSRQLQSITTLITLVFHDD